jgi:hypothetical protein
VRFVGDDDDVASAGHFDAFLEQQIHIVIRRFEAHDRKVRVNSSTAAVVASDGSVGFNRSNAARDRGTTCSELEENDSTGIRDPPSSWTENASS